MPIVARVIGGHIDRTRTWAKPQFLRFLKSAWPSGLVCGNTCNLRGCLQ